MQWSKVNVESSDAMNRIKVETQIDRDVVFQVSPDGTITLVPIGTSVQVRSSASARSTGPIGRL